VINEGEANYIDLSNIDTFTVKPSLDKNGSGEFFFVAPKTGYYHISDIKNCTVKVSDMNKREVRGLDDLSGGGRYNILKGENVYLKVNTSKTDYSFKITNPKTDELVFAPDRYGTFIYDNRPEMLISEDLADAKEGYGNSSLIVEDNLTGIVDIATSHMIHWNCLSYGNSKVAFEYLLTNTSQNSVSIEVERVGIRPDTNLNSQWLSQTVLDYTAFSAWADYMECDLTEPYKFNGNSVKNESYKYDEYISNTKKNDINENLAYRLSKMNGSAILKPGQTIDLFDAYRALYSPGSSSTTGFVIARLNIETLTQTGEPINGVGSIKLTSIAFNDVNSVIDSNGNFNLPQDPDVITGNRDEFEGDLADKAKGKTNSIAETETDIVWNIDNNTINNNYYSPIVFNLGNPNGSKIQKDMNNQYIFYSGMDNAVVENSENSISWTTKLNPANDYTAFYSGDISDIMGYTFTDGQQKKWYFDPFHKRPNKGNGVITTQEILDYGAQTGHYYDPDSCSMGNFSVIERYNIKLNNNTTQNRKISFMVRTISPFFYQYTIDGNPVITNIKCDTSEKSIVDGSFVAYELFNVTIEPNNSKNIKLETEIPNIGTGGFINMLRVE